MGHRGRLVIEQNGERQFFNIDGANTVQWWLVLGPDGVQKLVHGLPKSAWIEATWRSECGIYVNHDARELLWFGGEDERFFFQPREDLLALLVPAWEEWSVSWAHSGLFDIARRCGLSLGNDAPNPEPKLAPTQWTETLHEVIAGPCQSGDPYFGSDFLLTVDDGSQIRAILAQHPRLFDGAILKAPPEALLALPGLTTEELHLTNAPNQGIHIDVTKEAVRYWSAYYQGDLGGLGSDGWSYEHIYSEFNGHLELATPTVVSTHETDRVERLTRCARSLIYRNLFHAHLSAWQGRQSMEVEHYDWLFDPDRHRIRLALSLHAACDPALTEDEAYELLDPSNVLPGVLEHLRRSFNYPAVTER